MMVRCNSCFREYDDSLGLCPHCGYAQGDPAGEAFALTPGTLIANRYTIGGLLGAGGFGIIYKAWDNTLNRVLAIKEHFPSSLVNRLPGETDVILVATKKASEFAHGRNRFLEEARNTAKFNTHKNIVNVYDYFEENNTAYFVMEYLDGQTLDDVLLEQDGPLSYDVCVNIATSICAALRAIHKEKILHRDISPNNIMICRNGTIKLFDFGAARFSAEVESKASIVLKQGFAPVEQYDRVNRQDPRTDIYALGATLYYAMTGVRPEESTNRKIDDHLADPAAIVPSIPQNVSDTIMRAMAIEQQYRFSSVDEFEKAFLNEKRILSVQMERKKRKRRRVLSILAAFALVAALSTTSLFLWLRQKNAATLPDANLDVWYITTGQEDSDRAKSEALNNTVNSFCEEYRNVTVNLFPMTADTYASALDEASKIGHLPAVFESTGREEESVTLTPLADALDNLADSTYYTTQMEVKTRYPTGIVAPVIYVNSVQCTLSSTADMHQISEACGGRFEIKASAIGMYTSLYGDGAANYTVTGTALDDFISRKTDVYLGDSSDYLEIQRSLPGEYTLLMPDVDRSTYRYHTTWSIAAMDRDSTRSATALVEYFNSDLAQDYQRLQTQSADIPITKSMLPGFIAIYPELAPLEDYLKLPFSAPAE